jgi:hypothetical protein
LATFNFIGATIPIIVLIEYYHTMHPLSTYSKTLNYGGNFYINKLFTSDNASITGTLTTTGNTSIGGILSIGGVTTTTGNFNVSSTLPTGTTRLNYEGYLYSTRVYSATDIRIINATYDGILATTTLTTNKTWTMPNQTGIILVASTTAQTSGYFDTYTSVPSHNTVNLNYDGILSIYALKFVYATSAGATAVSANTITGGVYTLQANTSDIRLKRSIESLPYGINDIIKLRPVSFYTTNSEDTKRNIGFIAQELKEVIPESVFGEETENSYLTVNYDYIVPVLVKAVQDLYKIVITEKSKTN